MPHLEAEFNFDSVRVEESLPAISALKSSKSSPPEQSISFYSAANRDIQLVLDQPVETLLLNSATRANG
jgi:hypothetical protein